ncbi:hypothetical protein BGZ88_005753 [Linnemannia elongata]|nr:hypothetical protein BGZ88_005753 [Linnemannia elongata]
MAVDEHRSPSTTTTTTTASIHNSSSSPSSFKTRVRVKDQAFATPTSLTMPSTRIPNPDVNLLSVTAPKATTAKTTTITPKETTDTQRRPSDLVGGALWDLRQLKDGDELGLDAELVEDDVRLREPEHASRLLFTTTPDYYMHPNLEIFPDAEKKAIAQSNYNTIMDALTTSYCTYEAWKAFDLSNLSSSTSSSLSLSATQQQHSHAIPQISPGTRANDGITPKPQPATVSFFIFEDMFQTWLIDHQVSTNCLYTRRSPKPLKIKASREMAARTSWTYLCRCCKKATTTKNGRGGEKQQAKDGVMKPSRRLGCRAKFTAFSGISRPFANGVDGADGTDGTGTKTMKKVGVTLIVYEYEHNHDIRHLVATNKETDRSRDLRLSREKREELARHIKVLLARGFEIREVAQMLGANAKRCRELHMRGGNGSKGRRFGRKDYLTRSDVVKALELLQSIEAWGTQRSLDKESQVGDAEEESKEEAEIEEGEPAVEKKESEREVEKALEVDVDDDKVEEVSKEQWQMDILRKALKDLYCLKETSGLDSELDEDDPRLHGLGSSTDTNGQQRGSHIYTHPHLEIFRDIRSKQRAQHNYNLIMDSLTTNYFIYGAWILLGFSLPSSTRDPTSTSHLHSPPPQITPITQGTRSIYDGTTPSPSSRPGILSFHVPNDMFRAWLEDHQVAVGCEFSLVRWAAAPTVAAAGYPSSGSSENGQASEMAARRCLYFVCSRHETGSAGGAGTAGESQDFFGGGGGCKAQIAVYVGISKPLARSLGGGNGRMVDVALVVYHYEHNHSLQAHNNLRSRPFPSSSSSSYCQSINNAEEAYRQGRMDRWAEQIKTLLLRGNTLLDTILLFGGFVRWRRESGYIKQLRRLSGQWQQQQQKLVQQGEQQGREVGETFGREDYFTRGDLSEILKRLINSGGGGSGGVKDVEVGVRTGEEQQQDVIENICQEAEQEAEDDDEECYFTLDDISICPFPLPAYKAYETGPVETREQERRQQQEQEQELRTTIDLESSSLVEEMVDSLKVIKPLSGPVPSTAGGSNGSRGSEDGPQGFKRRRG